MSTAIVAGATARGAHAQTVIFEQNASGQAYFYTAPNGNAISGNYPVDNNWSQSLTYGSYSYTVGSNTVNYPYENAPSNWSTPTYPNSTSTDVLIPGLPVTLDVSVSVHNLTINASGGVSMLAGTTLNIAGPVITDNGQIIVNSQPSGGNTILNFSGGTVSGTGMFVLNEAAANAQLNGSLTQSAGHSIGGYGQVNAVLTNNGTVNANYSGQILYLQTSNMTNNGLFEATGGGNLYINSINVTQGTGGVISAGSTSAVQFNSANISNGTLNSSTGSAITVASGTNLFASLTNNAQINLLAGTTINVTGNLADNGQFLINSQPAGGATIVNFSSGTLSGTGSFVLNESGSNAQLNGTLTQSAGHNIFGYGQINAALTNNGIVNANFSNQTLYLQTSNMANNNLFQATAGGTLEIDGITVTQGTNGLISATGTGARINLSGTNISNGTLNTSGGAIVYQTGNPDTFANLTSNAQVYMPAGTTINVIGNFVDNGSILINSQPAGGATILNFSGGTVSGTGSFVLNENTTNAQVNGTLTQSANHSIFGYGQINAALTNNGTVNANVSGQTLTLQTSSMTNNATFTSSNGGTLVVNGIALTQGAAGVVRAGFNSGTNFTNATVNGGTINASSGSTITLNTAVLTNTTFNSPSGSTVIVQGGVSSIGSVMQNAAGSVVDIIAGATLNITGSLVDNGTFVVNSQPAGGNTILNFSGGTITGTGSFVLNEANANAQLNGTLTQPAGHSIGGYGQVNAALTNNGTVNANYSGQVLYLQTSNMTNNGLFEATGGGNLYIDGISVTEGSGGVILAGSSSAVQLNSANISGGTLNSATGSAITVASGANLFASVNNNAQLNLQAGATINVTGNMVDNGQILIDSQSAGGATILNFSGGTVSGAGSFVLNESTNNAQVNGTLTQSAGHSIFGYGQINAALTNNSTVNANVSGQTLYLQTSNMSNNSLFEATAGGILYINGITVTQGAGALIAAGNGSAVQIYNTGILGGTLNSSSGTAITATGTNLFASVTSNAQINLQAGNTINVTGNLIDNGQILIDSQSAGGATILNFSGGTVSGAGSFVLNESTNNAQVNGTLTQSAGHSIFGYGQINAALTNNSSVNANVSGQTLYLQTSNMSNNSLFEATVGGILEIDGITVTQSTGGLISATGSGTRINLGGTTISGGTLNTSGGAIVFQTGNPDTFSSLTSNAQVYMPVGSTINVTGNLVDNGLYLINYQPAGGTTILNFSGGTVSGTGSFVLNESGTNAQLNGTLTQSAGHSIFGYGQINAALTNNGTVNANSSGNTLALNGTTTGTGTFQASSGGTLNIGGNLTISAPGSLIGAGAASPVLISTGASLIDNGAVTGLPAITDNGILTIAANPNTGILIRSLTSLSLGTSATATVGTASNFSNRTLLTTSALAFTGYTNAWTGTLNLANNDLDVAGGSLGDITNQISEGYNGGNWQGPGGIISTAAAANASHLFTLGSIQNNQSGTALFTASHQFDGTTPGVTDILVKYTYYGDANLSGKVDGSDYALIDNGYAKHLTGWYNGDFNYDGIVNGSDYTLIDNAFNRQGVQLTTEVANATDLIAGQPVNSIGTSVPEPGPGTLFGISAISVLARRRHRARLV